MSFEDQDNLLMQEVLALAERGLTSTHPNPMVACIIMNEGQKVGVGYHSRAGEPHAERMALLAAGDNARGGTAYINLEPCCHQGRTPPCTDALIDAGISRVVAAMSDPNPLVAGGGFELLTAAGIEVISGVLEDEARSLNKAFVTRMTTAKPWVTLKSAATLDGRTAAHNGESKWITGDAARTHVQHIRAAASAVLTGIGTILADDPKLNVRLVDHARQPIRVVIDAKLEIPLNAKIIGDDSNCMVVTSIETSKQKLDKIAELEDLGVEIARVKALEGSDRLDLNDVLVELANWQFNHVVVEAGAKLSGAFIEANLIDELVLFYAGSILGDKGRGMFDFNSSVNFSDRSEFKIRDVKMVGGDFCVSAFRQQALQYFGVL